jgi:hypothetical protein
MPYMRSALASGARGRGARIPHCPLYFPLQQFFFRLRSLQGERASCHGSTRHRRQAAFCAGGHHRECTATTTIPWKPSSNVGQIRQLEFIEVWAFGYRCKHFSVAVRIDYENTIRFIWNAVDFSVRGEDSASPFVLVKASVS